MDAENSQQVLDWLWSSGQLSPKDIDTLPSLGIQAVINLALPTSSQALPDEAARVTRHGLAYIHIPVEWEHPAVEQFTQFTGVLKAFEGSRVWVHCAKNMRASAFIALYRHLVLAEPEEAAFGPMRAVWTPNKTWRAFIGQVVAASAKSPLKNSPQA